VGRVGLEPTTHGIAQEALKQFRSSAISCVFIGISAIQYCGNCIST